MKMILDYWNESPDWLKALALVGVRLLIGSVNWPRLYQLTIRLLMLCVQLARRARSSLKRAGEGEGNG